MDKYMTSSEDKTDYSTQICSDLLEKHGVAIVPGGDFGIPNSARISLVPTKDFFAEAIGKIVDFMKS